MFVHKKVVKINKELFYSFVKNYKYICGEKALLKLHYIIYDKDVYASYSIKELCDYIIHQVKNNNIPPTIILSAIINDYTIRKHIQEIVDIDLIKKVFPIYNKKLHPETTVYRLVGSGIPAMPCGKSKSGFWTISKEDINKLYDLHEQASFDYGYSIDIYIIKDKLKNYIPDPILHWKKKENHDEFDYNEIFLVEK